MNEARVSQAMRRAARSHCTLCGSKPVVAVGVFLPTSKFAKLIGEPAGKSRIAVYGLCEECLGRPDKAEAIEDALLREFGPEG